MRVLVTNGETRPALAVTRSLGRLGHEVFVAAEHYPALAAESRYCAGRDRYPAPAAHSGTFVQAIVSIIERRRIDLVLPITEVTTWLLAEQRDLLPPGCVLPLPATESLRVANDKSCVLALADELGIPRPRTRTVVAPTKAPAVSSDWDYPVVIKPARSRVWASSGWLSAGVDYASNVDELHRKLALLPRELFPVLLQERIIGDGLGVFACYEDGRPVALFSHRRLREKPPSGGVSVLCESVPLDSVAADYANCLLSRLHWHGVAMVEFKRSDRDGSLRLMEINGRFWGSLQLAIDAGVDFPALVAQMAGGARVEPVTCYRTGVRSRWFLGDLDALIAVLFHDSRQLNLPAGHASRLRSVWQFLKPLPGRQRGEVLRLIDPRPGLLEIRQWLRGRRTPMRDDLVSQ